MHPRSSAIPGITLANGMTISQLGFGTLAVQPNREATDANAEITAGIVAQALKAGPLENLGVAQLDLFLIHWPLPSLYNADYVSTWKAVAKLVGDGRLRSAGVSNFLPAHLDRIIDETGIAPAVNQFELHPYFANRATCEACRRYGIAVEAHSPLSHNRAPLGDPTITSIAGKRGRSTAQIILRWHIQHADIVIPKSVRPEHMRENIDIFDFELSSEEMAAIDALDRGDAGRVGPHPSTYEG